MGEEERLKFVGKCQVLEAPTVILPPSLLHPGMFVCVHLSIHHPFLNSVSESITLIKSLLFGRYWAWCQGHKENKKLLLGGGSGKHKNSVIGSGQGVTSSSVICQSQSGHRLVAWRLLEALVRIHIPEPASESKSSREYVLNRSPGDSDVQPGLGIQLTEVQVRWKVGIILK